MIISMEMKQAILDRILITAIDKAMEEECSGVHAAKMAVTQVSKAAFWLSTDQPEMYAKSGMMETQKIMRDCGHIENKEG